MVVAGKDVKVAMCILLFAGGCALTSAKRQHVILDQSTDAGYGWKLLGPYIYFSTGESLHMEKSFLPKDFDYHAFTHKAGIWAAIPDITEGLPPMGVNISLGYTGTVQLLDTIEITHCIHGDAKISLRVRGNILYTITPPTSPTYTFVITKIPIHSREFAVEGIVPDNRTGSFILIDRIEGIWGDATTTTIRPVSTTPRIVTTTLSSYANKAFDSFQFINLIMILAMICW